MCFEFDALPPDLPDGRALIAGAAAAESLTLTAADGNELAAALAESAEPSGPGVVILPDVRGLYRFYVALAERLAEAGHDAIAFDYFGRTAGAEERGEDFDYMPHVQQTTIEGVQTDLAAARAALAERTGATRFASLGFCFGGGHSFWAGANPDLGLDAVVGFYGLLNPGERTNRPNLVERGDEIKVPVLGLFGGDDPNIPPADIQAFDAGLERAGVDHEIVTYPGAPHSFFDRKQEEFAEASSDAWTRVLDFLAAEPVEAIV
ncbi:MAG TPA: dienelactone hydrolase family protein [Solirubrobacterales bacterium]|jgi:carboxymethylenebutenolidase